MALSRYVYALSAASAPAQLSPPSLTTAFALLANPHSRYRLHLPAYHPQAIRTSFDLGLSSFNQDGSQELLESASYLPSPVSPHQAHTGVQVVEAAVERPSLRTLSIREGFERHGDRLYCIGVDVRYVDVSSGLAHR